MPERGMLNLTGTCLNSWQVFKFSQMDAINEDLGMQIIFLFNDRMAKFFGLEDLATERISLQQLRTELNSSESDLFFFLDTG